MSRLVLSSALFGVLALVACAPKAPAPVEAPTASVPPPDPEAWRATRPAPGVERAWKAPAATRFTLSNGLPVYLVPQGDLPLVSVRLWLGLGREANPAGKAGLVALTASMLDEGTKTRDSATIAADAARLGAELYVNAGDESTVVALDALTGETLGPSLDLMADVVLRPRFDKKDFARVQGDVVAAIQAAAADPNDVARRVFLAELYGAAHPYGTPAAGTVASVKALKLADVTKAYAQHFHAGNAALVVVGKLDEAAARAALEPRFGAWKAQAPARAPVAAPAAPTALRVVFKEQPGAVQSALRVGGFGPARGAPEYWRDLVTINLFGGMFSSRLNMALREEKGWSYGAYAGLADSRDFGVFQARSNVQADKTAESLQVILDELAGQAARVPTDAEMTLVRDSLTKSLPGNFESNAATAQAFVNVPAYGLGADAWQTFPASVDAVDAAAVAAGSKARLDKATMVAVVVGPRVAEVDDGKGGKTTIDVVASLRALGHTFVEVR